MKVSICFTEQPILQKYILYCCPQLKKSIFTIFISSTSPDRWPKDFFSYEFPRSFSICGLFGSLAIKAFDCLSILLRFSSAFFDISIFKSAPYHRPCVSSSLNCYYYGDGFGIWQSSKDVPWFPKLMPLYDKLSSYNFIGFMQLCDYYSSPKAIVNVQFRDKLMHLFSQEAIRNNLSDFVSSKLRDYSDIIVASRLSGIRLNADREHCLLHDYISSAREKSKSKFLIIPHPHHKSYSMQPFYSLQKLSNQHGILDIDICGLNSCLDTLYEVPLELLCFIINADSGLRDMINLHMFQSSYLSIRSLYPDINIKFGYGRELIKQYFFDSAISLSLETESNFLDTTFYYV